MLNRLSNYHFFKLLIQSLFFVSLLNNILCITINNSKFHGIYNDEGIKLNNQSFNFSSGTWYTFSQTSKDGRIMEFHPNTAGFVKIKTVKIVSSLGYFEPNGRIIAFYKNKRPLPKTTYGNKYGVVKGQQAAKQKVANLLKNDKNILQNLNQFPSFNMKDFMKTEPWFFSKFWRKVGDLQEEDFLDYPFKDSYTLTKKD